MHGKLAISAALVGLLAQVSTATTCTPQTATALEPYISSGGGGAFGPNLVDPSWFVSHAIKKRTTPDARLANIANVLAARDLNSVECTAAEACVSLSNVPFCLNMANGDFHDGLGDTGNTLTGDYVLADGRKGNMYTGPYPQATVAGASAATTTGGASGSAQTGSSGSGSSGSGSSGAGSSGSGSSGAGSSGAGSAGAGKTGSGAVASTPTATGAGAAATPTKNAAANGKAGGVAVGGAMALLGAALL